MPKDGIGHGKDHLGPEPPTGPIGALRRPALLVRTARIAAPGYRRGRDLRRILGDEPPSDPAAALVRLAEIEGALEWRRRTGAGGYLPSAHVAVLAALIVEARAATDPGDVT